MIKIIQRFIACTRATAAVETAIFAPIFLVVILGITDLGSGMFVGSQVNAAAQAGAAYAVKNLCASTCLTSIKTAMNDATGNSSFCSSASCTAQIQNCTGGTCSFSTSCAALPSQCIITVTASNYPYSPILPDAVYSWTSTMNLSASAPIRVQ
jgi:Flp pilus assembly protein TadG